MIIFKFGDCCILWIRKYWFFNFQYVYTFSNGSQIEFFSADQPDKLKGPRRDYLWIDECNNVTEDSFDEKLDDDSNYDIFSTYLLNKEIGIVGFDDEDFGVIILCTVTQLNDAVEYINQM